MKTTSKDTMSILLVYIQCPPLSIVLLLYCVVHLQGPHYEEIVPVGLVGAPAQRWKGIIDG